MFSILTNMSIEGSAFKRKSAFMVWVFVIWALALAAVGCSEQVAAS